MLKCRKIHFKGCHDSLYCLIVYESYCNFIFISLVCVFQNLMAFRHDVNFSEHLAIATRRDSWYNPPHRKFDSVVGIRLDICFGLQDILDRHTIMEAIYSYHGNKGRAYQISAISIENKEFEDDNCLTRDPY